MAASRAESTGLDRIQCKLRSPLSRSGLNVNSISMQFCRGLGGFCAGARVDQIGRMDVEGSKGDSSGNRSTLFLVVIKGRRAQRRRRSIDSNLPPFWFFFPLLLSFFSFDQPCSLAFDRTRVSRDTGAVCGRFTRFLLSDSVINEWTRLVSRIFLEKTEICFGDLCRAAVVESLISGWAAYGELRRNVSSRKREVARCHPLIVLCLKSFQISTCRC